MCLLMVQRDDHDPLPKEMFDKIWDNNPHGFGVGFLHKTKNEFVTRKTMKKDDAWKIYNEVRNANKYYQWLILHWRWATHGLKNEDNCHPFRSGPDFLIAHNGVMTIPANETYDKDWSDTRYFAHVFRRDIPNKDDLQDFKSKENQEFVNRYRGTSRLVTFRKRDRVEDCKMWLWGFPDQEKEFEKYGTFSNYGWKSPRVVRSYSSCSSSCSTTPRDSESNRYRGLLNTRDIVPELPTVWWICEQILDDPQRPFVNIIGNFHEQWDRMPTHLELRAAWDMFNELHGLDDIEVPEIEEPIIH